PRVGGSARALSRRPPRGLHGRGRRRGASPARRARLSGAALGAHAAPGRDRRAARDRRLHAGARRAGGNAGRGHPNPHPPPPGPEAMVWQPRWLSHPNGALALASIVIAVADVEEVARRFARFTDREAKPSPLGQTIELDRGCVQLVTADAFARKLPEVAIPS